MPVLTSSPGLSDLNKVMHSKESIEDQLSATDGDSSTDFENKCKTPKSDNSENLNDNDQEFVSPCLQKTNLNLKSITNSGCTISGSENLDEGIQLGSSNIRKLNMSNQKRHP